MRKGRKLMAISLSLLMIVGCFAGCSKTKETTNTSDTNTATPTVAKSNNDTQEQATPAADDASSEDKTITVCLQNDPGKKEGWEAVADAYTTLHPDVKVVVDLKASDKYDQWVQTAFTTADTTADIVAINLAGDTCNGKAINYSDYINNDSPYSDGTWMDQFEYAKQKINMATGEFNALSLESVQVMWLYNQDIFDKAGVTIPKNWDELVTVCDKIQAAGYQPIAMDGDYDSFYSGRMGWLAQVYADQTTRSIVNTTRAQEKDYCYDPDIDSYFKYDPADPFNDDADKVTQNPVRTFNAVLDGTFAGNSKGMATVWENMAKVFPKYCGGDTFFGTNADGSKTLFYQGKAAMRVDGGWGIIQFKNDMKALEAGQDVTDSAGNVIKDTKAFTLGTFNMPSMEGEGIEGKARTIEVANGFIGCISKSQAHDDLVVDFLMYYSSAEGMSVYLNAAIDNGYVPNGPSLVYNVSYPEDIQNAFDNLTFVGNCQKDFNNMLARGIGESAETFRDFYKYSYDYLSGTITLDQWLQNHEDNIMSHVESAMAEKGVGKGDLENPQNAPTGN